MDNVKSTIEAAYPFTVEKEPASYRVNGCADPGDYRAEVTTDEYFLYRTDQPRNYSLCRSSTVSGGYNPHTTSEVVDLAAAAAGAWDDHGGWGTEVRCSWKRGHVVEIAPSREHQRRVAQEDKLFPRILIQASYDSASVVFTAAMFRHLCQNLLMPCLVTGTVERIRHDGRLAERMVEITAACRSLRGRWDALVNWSERLSQQRVDLAEFLTDVYGQEPMEGRTRTNHVNRVEQIFSRVVKERQQQGRDFGKSDSGWIVTGWEAYNVVQGYHQHQQRRARATDDLQRAMLAADDKYVRRAEQLLSAAA